MIMFHVLFKKLLSVTKQQQFCITKVSLITIAFLNDMFVSKMEIVTK